MKYIIALLLLAQASAAQTYRTVTADTNNVIRTNFTLVRTQVTDLGEATFAISNITGLQTSLDEKLITNGNAIALTNFPANLLRTNGDASGLTNLPNGNLSSNVIGVLSLSNGGTGGTNATTARISLGIQATGTGGAALLGQGAGTQGETNATGAALGNFARTQGAGAAAGQEAKVFFGAGGLSADGGAVGSFAEVNGGGGAIGGFTFAIQGFAGGRNASASATNSVQLGAGTNTNNFTIQFYSAGIVDTNEWAALANAGTTGTNLLRATSASNALTMVLPAYAGNAGKVLAVNSATNNVEWVTGGGGGGTLTNIDLSSTNVVGVLSISNGGTGGTNTESAVLGLGILNTNDYSVNLFYGGTNASNQHIVIGPYATAYGTNLNENAVVIGRNASSSNNGVAIGYAVFSESGIALGYNAFASGQGVAVGNYALAQGGTLDPVNDLGGIAIGPSSFSSTNLGVAIGATAAAEGNGVSVGYNADSRGGTNGGVAIGFGADVYEGIGIGVLATANNGVAIGANAVDNNEGVAIGIRASTVNGAAIGIDAASDVGYQIGTGTNGESMEPTIQFMDAGEVYTNQWTALANSTALGHSAMAATIATNSPTNTNAPSPDAWMLITEGTNNYYLPLWQ